MSMDGKIALKNPKYFVNAWLEDPYFWDGGARSKMTKAGHIATCTMNGLNDLSMN